MQSVITSITPLNSFVFLSWFICLPIYCIASFFQCSFSLSLTLSFPLFSSLFFLPIGSLKNHSWLPAVPTSHMTDTLLHTVHTKVATGNNTSTVTGITPIQHTRAQAQAHVQAHVHTHAHVQVHTKDFTKECDQFQDTEHTKQDDVTLSTRTGDSRSELKDRDRDSNSQFPISNTNSTRSSMRKNSIDIDWFDTQSATECSFYNSPCTLDTTNNNKKETFEAGVEEGEWVEFFDVSAQANYWFNHTTGEASWVPPDKVKTASST